MISLLLTLQAALYAVQGEAPDLGLGTQYSVRYGHPGESRKARKGWGDKLNFQSNGVASQIRWVTKGKI